MLLNFRIMMSICIAILVIVMTGCATGDPDKPLPSVDPSISAIAYVDQLIESTIAANGWLDRLLIEPMKARAGNGFESRIGVYCSLHDDLRTKEQFRNKMMDMCISKGGTVISKKYCVAGSTPAGAENVMFAFDMSYAPACINNGRSPGNMNLIVVEKTTTEPSLNYIEKLKTHFRYKSVSERNREEKFVEDRKNAQRAARKSQADRVKAQVLAEARGTSENEAMMRTATLGQRVCRWGSLNYRNQYAERHSIPGAIIGEFLRHNNSMSNLMVEVRIQGWATDESKDDRYREQVRSTVSGQFHMDGIAH